MDFKKYYYKYKALKYYFKNIEIKGGSENNFNLLSHNSDRIIINNLNDLQKGFKPHDFLRKKLNYEKDFENLQTLKFYLYLNIVDMLNKHGTIDMVKLEELNNKNPIYENSDERIGFISVFIKKSITNIFDPDLFKQKFKELYEQFKNDNNYDHIWSNLGLNKSDIKKELKHIEFQREVDNFLTEQRKKTQKREASVQGIEDEIVSKKKQKHEKEQGIEDEESN